MATLVNLVWVAAGGALGSGARYLVAVGTVRWLGAGWPLATLIVNVLGSLLLGALLELFLQLEGGHAGLRLSLTTGMMGGFTTYSTFNFELLEMLQSGRMYPALLYLMTTVVACLVAGAVGIVVTRGMMA